MGKSKKTLALVMALVMAFTIVPFGAWGILNAAAEGPNAQAVTDAYVPAKELIKGQEYVVAGKAEDGSYYAITQSSEETPKGSPVIAQPFEPATGFNDTDLEYRSTWTYDYSSSNNGWFSHPTELFTEPSSDGNAYIDVNETKNAKGVYAYRNDGNGKHIFNTASSDGSGAFLINYSRGSSAWYIELVDQGGKLNFQPTQTETPLYIFEKVVDAPETTMFPIHIRDLHKDNILIDLLDDPQELFNLSTSNNTVPVNIGEAISKLLNSAGSRNSAGYRTGLTQEELKDGKLQYSPYVVIYVAHALRETLYNYTGGGIYDQSTPINGTPLGAALQKKFSRNYTHRDTRLDAITYSRWELKPNGEKDVLDQNGVNGLCNLLQDSAKKHIIDEFLLNCDTNYKDETVAETYLSKNSITGNSQKILMDYWVTVNHADTLTYERIVNENPCYDPCTLSERDDVLYGLGQPYYRYKDIEYKESGATMMDVAWYMLHHFFEDTTEETKATSLSGNFGSETNFEYFSKTVDDSAKYLELKRIVADDGSITYRYDSAYKSTWGNANEPIRNIGINQMNYQGDPSASTAYFHPIDGKGFGNTNGNINYGYSLQGSGKFVYNSADNLYFSFNGDDDAILYINGKRVDSVDLGGAHGPVTGSVKMNEIAEEFGLENGGVYDFDFFYMERNPVGANLRIETNIKVINTGISADMRAVKDGKEIPSLAGVKDGETIYYALSAFNQGSKVGGTVSVSLQDVVLYDKKIDVKISKEDVTGVNAGDVKFVLSKYNKDTQSWTDEELANYDAAKAYFANLAPGYKITALVPYTVDSSKTGKSFDNILDVTANLEGTTGYAEVLNADAHHNLKVLDINDRTIVVDFAGTLKYSADKIFSHDELGTGIERITSKLSVTDNQGKLALNSDDNSITYTISDFFSTTESFTVTEEYSFDDKPYYTTTKTITFAPANNVYYDDSFNGIKFDDKWSTSTSAGGVLNGMSGTEVIYGNNSEAVSFDESTHFIQGAGEDKKVGASFEFTGKGFSLYMNTNANSGNILVRTTNLDDPGAKPVLDYIDISSQEDFKNVPVVNRVDLGEHATYKVEINASIANGKTANLTGIRVYNPMKDENTTGIYIDSEQNARFVELRDALISGSVLTDAQVIGSLYVNDNVKTVADLKDYVKDGPKNEIYLEKGCGVAFKVKDIKADTKLQVSARALNLDAPAVLTTSGETNQVISSAMDMYYKVAIADDGLVTIKNTGDGVLALTNIKITGSNTTDVNMVVSRSIAENAIALMNTIVEPETPDVPETPEEPETPSKPQSPIFKFFEDLINFFAKLFGKH